MNQPEQHRMRRFWRWLLLLPIVVVVWVGIVALGVYRLQWSGPRTAAVLRWTPLPAAWSKTGWFSMAEFLSQRSAVQHYTTYLASTTSGIYQGSDVAAAGQTALSTMIRNAAAEHALQALHVDLTAADVDQAYQAQLQQIGTATEVQRAIQSLYGWTPEQFKQNVIRPTVVRNKLQEKLSFDAKLSATAAQQAQRVLELVKADPKNFATLAKKYSEDSYGVNGGDLGFIGSGQQAQEIDDVAFSLPLNTVSGIVHTKYGYHILQVTEKKTVDGQDQIHLWQITILAPQVDAYLDQQLRGDRITVLAPGLRWDTKSAQVVRR